MGSRGRSASYDSAYTAGSGIGEGAQGRRPVGMTIDPMHGDGIKRLRAERFERLMGGDVKPKIEPDDTPKRPRVEGIPNDMNLNVTFKRARPEVDHHLDEKKIKYAITKHIDTNRDMYFIKLVSGALKRKSFHSLIKVEQEEKNTIRSVFSQDDFDIKIKYSYSEQLLYAWATVLDKIKDMIDPAVKMTDRGWVDSKTLYERILKNDTLLLAFARYVAFIMMSESNNMVPRNKTRYVLNDQSRIEDERVLSVMRALKYEMGIIDPRLAELYLTS